MKINIRKHKAKLRRIEQMVAKVALAPFVKRSKRQLAYIKWYWEHNETWVYDLNYGGLEITPGFEYHKEELKSFRLQVEADWTRLHEIDSMDEETYYP